MLTRHAPRELRGFFMYLAGAFGLAWLCWLPLVLAVRWDVDAPVVPAVALSVIGSFAPLLAAAWAARRWPLEDGSVDPLAALVRWRVGFGWYAIALLGAVPVPLASLGLDMVLGGPRPAWAAPIQWLQVPVLMATAVPAGPLGEEPGWRGYALPALRRRLGLVSASLVVGVIWAMWHLPLFALPGTVQHASPPLGYIAWVIGLSIVFAWLYLRGGKSVLLTVLLHAAVNTWWWVLPVLPRAAGTDRPFLISVLLTWIVAGALVPSMLRNRSGIGVIR